MGVVAYNGNKIIPAPLVSVQKTYDKSGDGTILGSKFNITINGTIVTYKGSPDSNGDFHTDTGYPEDEVIASDARLAAMFRKQEALRDLFSTEGQVLEFQSADGSFPMKCNPRFVDINFAERVWHDRCEYTATFEADVVSVLGEVLGEDAFTEYITSADENWQFETNEGTPDGLDAPRTYKVTHTVSAVGKRFYNSAGSLESEAWQQAKDYVLPKLGFDNSIGLAPDSVGLPASYLALNHVKNENTDELAGSYSVTESWILTSGTAIEDFTVSARSNFLEGTDTVTVEGSITGLEVRDGNFQLTSSKYDNATTKFTSVQSVIPTRAATYSGVTLNAIPVNVTIGRNPVLGTISYSYEYNTRPSNTVTGAFSEVVSIQDSWNVDQFGSVSVLGRNAGPILQDLNTTTAATRTLSIELAFGPSSAAGYTAAFGIGNPRFAEPQATQIALIIAAADPVVAGVPNNVGVVATTEFASQRNQNWSPSTGRYSFNITWTFE